jgi:ABC-type antimicrobial peptide transport system permease subunit
LISGVGAAIGIGFAVAIPFLIETLVRFLPVRQGVTIPISWLSVLLAFVVSCATGVLFGYLPAKTAARIHPIELLRYEWRSGLIGTRAVGCNQRASTSDLPAS